MNQNEEETKCKDGLNNFKIIIIAVNYMLTLKDLPIFVSSRNSSLGNKPPLLDPIQLIKKKAFRMSEQNRKFKNYDPQPRLSHQTLLQQTSTTNKMKRRISTAGNSKRFPKDFFNMDDDIKNNDKSPKIAMKFKKKQLQNSLKNANKGIKAKPSLKNIECNQISEKQLQKTPKFNGLDEQQMEKQVNEFLIFEGAPKILNPYLSLDSISKGDQKVLRSKPINFIKKVKKGQMLRKQERLTKTVSENQCMQANILNVNKIRGCCY